MLWFSAFSNNFCAAWLTCSTTQAYSSVTTVNVSLPITLRIYRVALATEQHYQWGQLMCAVSTFSTYINVATYGIGKIVASTNAVVIQALMMGTV